MFEKCVVFPLNIVNMVLVMNVAKQPTLPHTKGFWNNNNVL